MYAVKNLKNLKNNEISDIITTDTAIYIMQKKDERVMQNSDAQEERDKIANMIYKRKLDLKLNHYMEKLQNDAFIDIRQRDLFE